MRTASQIKTAIVIAVVLLLGTNIMMHVAQARAKQKYRARGDYTTDPMMSYLFAYFVILFYGFLYATVKKNDDDEETQKMLVAIPGVGLLSMMPSILQLSEEPKKPSTPERQMMISALSIQIVVYLGFAGYIYSGMRK